MVKQMLEKCWEFNVHLHQIHVSFKQAYDTTSQHVLYGITLNLRTPKKLVSLTRMTMYHTRAQLKVNNNLTNAFETNLGQGDGVTRLQFNLALDQSIRKFPCHKRHAAL